MPINPITLDKMEPSIIRHIENKVVDRVVHEAKNTGAAKEEKNGNDNFNGRRQKQAAQQFGYYLSKFNIKLEYKILKDRVKVKLKDSKGRILIETDIKDVESLFENVKKETGSIIDLKG
jgi:hypothetical protein